MNRLQQLRAKRQKAKQALDALNKAAEQNDNGLLSAEQTQQFDTLVGEIQQIDAEITRQETLLRLGAGGSSDAQTPGAPGAPGAAAAPTGQSAGEPFGAEQGPFGFRAGGGSVGGRVTEPNARRQPSVEVIGRTQAYQRSWGFRDAAEYALAVRSASRGHVDQRLLDGPRSVEGYDPAQAETTYASGKSGADGGFAAPPMIEEGIWAHAFGDQFAPLRLLGARPTANRTVYLNRDETTPWGADGVQAEWEGEGDQIARSKPKIGNTALTLHRISALVPATDDILEDAPRLRDLILNVAPRAIGYKVVEAIHNGDGVGKPLGWRRQAFVSVAKESGQSADTIVLANLLKMRASMLGNYGRAFWIANSDTIPQLGSMTLGQNGVFVTTAREDIPDVLMGRPLLFLEQAETVGDEGDIQLVHPDGYALYVRNQAPEVASSIHFAFDQHIEMFRVSFRVGGVPRARSTVTPPKGANAKGYFVGVAVRS